MMHDLIARVIRARARAPHEWAEAEAPWLVWTLPYTDRLTRVTGRAYAVMRCAKCGAREEHAARIPRWGPVPEPTGGRHEYRRRAVAAHLHPGQDDPRDWAMPLLNMGALPPGADPLGIITGVVDSARLEAEHPELGDE